LASFHHCYFGWKLVLELQSFLYVPAHRFARLTGSSHPHTLRVLGSRGFYGRAYHGWLPAPCSGYANHPNRAIDGEGTRTPQTRQPCWLLRLPHSSIAVCRPTTPAQSPAWATPRLPVMAESPLAPSRCYLLGSRVEHDLDQRYPILIAPTGSCAEARSSVSLCHKL